LRLVDSLCSRVAAVAAATPARIAIVDGDRRIDYGTLWQQARDFAGDLQHHGVQPGDRIAIVLPNRIEAVVACYGAWLARAIAVPLNVQARERDFAPWLRHCEPACVVHERGHADVERVIAGLAVKPRAIALDPAMPLPSFPQRHPAWAGPETWPGRPAAIIYTSGTTGAPKGVTLSHANLLSNASAVVSYLGLRPGDSVLSVLPFYYAYGASVLHTHLISGARVVLEPNLLFPRAIVDTIAREGVTGFSGVASTFALLLDHGGLGTRELPRLRYLTHAGGALPTALAGRLRTALPRTRLFVMYGQTEATARICWLPPEQLPRRPGSAGRPLRGTELRVVGEDGNTARPGEPGEVEVRGPGVMLGYWNDPQATARAIHDGWLRTGDIGHLDRDGYLYLSGRRSDMVKTGAHRVFPGDVEEVIAEIPGVAEVAVVGIDDALLGQVVKAFVVAPSPLPRGGDTVKAHCRSRLAPYKVPREVEFVDALPRTASGKVRRVALKEEALT
jgi:long-chain acyl-CoA synthetase